MKLNSNKVLKHSQAAMKLNKTSSSSAQTVASIDDLLIEIFLSIPLKPLVRFKLVSKHWNFIISCQNFNFLRNQNPNPAVGLVFVAYDKSRGCSRGCYSSHVVSFDKPADGQQFRSLEFNKPQTCETMSSCNGLLLCRGRGIGIDEPELQKCYVCVCNPTTKKYFVLPKIIRPAAVCWYWMSLAFDPSKSPHYKVVCVTSHRHRCQLSVYSSETDCWRKHGEPFCSDADFNHGVYCNGAIHWVSTIITGKSLYFNPDNDEVAQVMPTPPVTTWCKRSFYCYFGESCGHLHYIDDYTTVMELNVYELRADYSEWFVKYRVDCSLIDNRLSSQTWALVRDKKEEDSFLVLQSEKRIIRYNLVYKTCETMYEMLDAAGLIYPHPFQYIESLSHV